MRSSRGNLRRRLTDITVVAAALAVVVIPALAIGYLGNERRFQEEAAHLVS